MCSDALVSLSAWLVIASLATLKSFHSTAGRADRLTFVILQKPRITVQLLAQMSDIIKHFVFPNDYFKCK